MNLAQYRPIDESAAISKLELNSLRQGFFVRLQLSSGERFWAMCTGRQRENQTFTGRVETAAGAVKFGDTVIFGREHVFEII